MKRIADRIRTFLSFFTNSSKEPDREKISYQNEIFHMLDNDKLKMHTSARAAKQKYISIYISLHMKTFLKTGVYIYIHKEFMPTFIEYSLGKFIALYPNFPMKVGRRLIRY